MRTSKAPHTAAMWRLHLVLVDTECGDNQARLPAPWWEDRAVTLSGYPILEALIELISHDFLILQNLLFLLFLLPFLSLSSICPCSA